MLSEVNYPTVGSCVSKRQTMTERLLGEKASLENRLADVNKALDAMKANPIIAEVVDIISKI